MPPEKSNGSPTTTGQLGMSLPDKKSKGSTQRPLATPPPPAMTTTPQPAPPNGYAGAVKSYVPKPHEKPRAAIVPPTQTLAFVAPSPAMPQAPPSTIARTTAQKKAMASRVCGRNLAGLMKVTPEPCLAHPVDTDMEHMCKTWWVAHRDGDVADCAGEWGRHWSETIGCYLNHVRPPSCGFILKGKHRTTVDSEMDFKQDEANNWRTKSATNPPQTDCLTAQDHPRARHHLYDAFKVAENSDDPDTRITKTEADLITLIEPCRDTGTRFLISSQYYKAPDGQQSKFPMKPVNTWRNFFATLQTAYPLLFRSFEVGALAAKYVLTAWRDLPAWFKDSGNKYLDVYLHLFEGRYLAGQEEAAELRGYLREMPPPPTPITMGEATFDAYYEAGLNKSHVKKTNLRTLINASPITVAVFGYVTVDTEHNGPEALRTSANNGYENIHYVPWIDHLWRQIYRRDKKFPVRPIATDKRHVNLVEVKGIVGYFPGTPTLRATSDELGSGRSAGLATPTPSRYGIPQTDSTVETSPQVLHRLRLWSAFSRSFRIQVLPDDEFVG
ncbi:hypothetical protein LTS10_008714 [Elasticomyces elasticus]|nr:hypothetical protein LTS10_008714 [Elasticomyces elasticus]